MTSTKALLALILCVVTASVLFFCPREVELDSPIAGTKIRIFGVYPYFYRYLRAGQTSFDSKSIITFKWKDSKWHVEVEYNGRAFTQEINGSIPVADAIGGMIEFPNIAQITLDQPNAQLPQ